MSESLPVSFGFSEVAEVVAVTSADAVGIAEASAEGTALAAASTAVAVALALAVGAAGAALGGVTGSAVAGAPIAGRRPPAVGPRRVPRNVPPTSATRMPSTARAGETPFLTGLPSSSAFVDALRLPLDCTGVDVGAEVGACAEAGAGGSLETRVVVLGG